ncbi:hypothetical protein BC938DRAFT_476718 [Jimgerdemannia flammicorona]|uniref:Aminoglycoside phosphotransferase domain-containing protein n=1 Tax=Jimgerdemannia flammicorona TaxID=994334 RepID=A0A433QQB2_9FUNG|nr:hypothetical protein BC938DRAFT_476718 [Jimgerdemannia flammicorona]
MGRSKAKKASLPSPSDSQRSSYDGSDDDWDQPDDEDYRQPDWEEDRRGRDIGYARRSDNRATHGRRAANDQTPHARADHGHGRGRADHNRAGHGRAGYGRTGNERGTHGRAGDDRAAHGRADKDPSAAAGKKGQAALVPAPGPKSRYNIQEMQKFFQQFPFFPPGSQVKRLEDVSQELVFWDSSMFRVTIAPNKGPEERLIVKIYKGDPAEAKKKRENEWMMLTELNERGFLEVPRPIQFSDMTRSPWKKHVIIMAEVAAASTLEQQERNTVELAKTMAALLYNLHRLNWKDYTHSAFWRDGENPEVLINKLQVLKSSTENVFPHLFTSWFQWLKRRVKKIVPRVVICHGDFVPSNILCPSDKGIGKHIIIDWAGNGIFHINPRFSLFDYLLCVSHLFLTTSHITAIGKDFDDYRLDFAWTYMMLKTTDVASAETAEAFKLEYSKLWSGTTTDGFDIDHFSYFVSFACLKRLVQYFTLLKPQGHIPSDLEDVRAAMQEKGPHWRQVYDLLRAETRIRQVHVERELGPVSSWAAG